MNYLLDTHILLWWLCDDPQLALKNRIAISNPKSIIFVSAASAWEIEIKKALGKLSISQNAHEIIKANNFTELPINIKHTLALSDLPNHHSNPFDRLLIAQCLTEKLTFITQDKTLSKYPVKIL